LGTSCRTKGDGFSEQYPLPGAFAFLEDLRKGETLAPRKIPDKGSGRALGVLTGVFRLPVGVQLSQGENLPLGGFRGGGVFSGNVQS
jgi:hypothetical protein